MTRQEAVETLNSVIIYVRREYATKFELALYMAVDELERQEPLKPRLMREGWNIEHNDYRCTACDTDIYYGQKYCDNCGRAVKWDASD